MTRADRCQEPGGGILIYLGLSQPACGARQSAWALFPGRGATEANSPNAHYADLTVCGFLDMRFWLSGIAPAGIDAVLSSEHIEIVADIGFERSGGRTVGFGEPDVDEDKGAVGLRLGKLNLFKVWNIQ